MSSPQKEHTNSNDSSTESSGVHTPDQSSGDSLEAAGTDPSNIFVSPPPGFDPNNEDIRNLLEGKKGKGTLEEGELEDPVEAIIERKIADLKKLREVSPEEENRLREKIKRLESGRWLEAIKSGLVGKKTVPIEYFNRLVEENESAIGYVTRQTARADRRLKDKDAKIKELQQRIKDYEQNGPNTQTTNDNLKRENDDLKVKLEKCHAHGTKSDARIKELEAALTAEEKATTDNEKKAGEDKCKKEVEDLQARIKKLEEDLNTARQTSSRHYNRVQELDRARQEGLAREQGLKNDVRNSDRQNGELQKLIDDLSKNGGGTNPKGGAGQPNDEENRLRKENERLRREVEDLRNRNETLRQEVEDLRNQVQRLINTTDNTDDNGAARIKELSDTIAIRDRRIRELMDANQTLETQRLQWMGGVGADPQWWLQVEAIVRAKGSLDRNVVNLYRRMGFTEENLDGEAAVARLIEAIDVHPREVNPLVFSILRITGHLNTALRNLETSNRRIIDLQRQLERANEPRDQEEFLARIGIFRDEEVDRRVEMRLTIQRNQQEALLRNIIGAGEELRAVSRRIPDDAMRNLVLGVRERFLTFQSLPQPQVPAQAHRR